VNAVTCREASNLLPLFFDGELDGDKMRGVALHSTRCETCEGELREMERVQGLINRTVNGAVDEIDLAELWPAVESQLGTVRIPWWSRLRIWWDEGEHGLMLGVPALAAAAAVAVLTVWFFTRVPQPTTQPDAPQVAAVDNAASIDSLETDVDSVAVVSDPETRTTVLWVSDDTPTGEEGP